MRSHSRITLAGAAVAGGAYSGATGGFLGARAADGTCLRQKAAPPYVLVTGDFVGTLALPTA